MSRGPDVGGIQRREWQARAVVRALIAGELKNEEIAQEIGVEERFVYGIRSRLRAMGVVCGYGGIGSLAGFARVDRRYYRTHRRAAEDEDGADETQGAA